MRTISYVIIAFLFVFALYYRSTVTNTQSIPVLTQWGDTIDVLAPATVVYQIGDSVNIRPLSGNLFSYPAYGWEVTDQNDSWLHAHVLEY
jgi:hypothetical protein